MTKKKQIRFWLTLFVGFLVLFIVLQLPAVWIISKVAPQQRMLQNISGNIWQGQADIHVQQLQATISWDTRPWELLRLRAAANVTLHSGQTQLHGVVAYGVGKNLYVQHVQGKVSPESFAALMNWQWPSASVNVQDLTVHYKKQKGFQAATGQLTWSGGMLAYPMGQRAERIDIPPLVGTVLMEKEKLKVLLRDSQQQRMADISLGNDAMLDIQITQRLLLNSPTYQGKAGLDTAVISTRQPLSSLRGI